MMESTTFLLLAVTVASVSAATVPGASIGNAPTASAVRDSSEAEAYRSINSLPKILCQLYLGDIPCCSATSCKEIAETRLGNSRSGLHWLTNSDNKSCQAYCIDSISPCKSRGWMRVGYINSNEGCPPNLTEVTAGGRKLCAKNVDIGCSSVIFPTCGLNYSKVCGKVGGYVKDSVDAFDTRHGYGICGTNCSIDQPYVDGVSITHGSPRQHIWSLGGTRHTPYCPCNGQISSLPSFVGEDYFCDVEGDNTYTIEDRLWDGVDCRTSCCERANWFCKDLPQSTTDDIEFRVCADETRSNEDIYIEYAEIFVQ